ncbi:hypothetical protein CY35_01G181300 [Sphagnum magellanicum]|nr:hypothetical protein CY35_01G181300 [Sphagnum magellanicum]
MALQGKKERNGGGNDGVLENPKRRKVGAIADAVPFCHADECINLRLVSTAGDLQDSEKAKPFPPEYSERYFGEDGKIYGYKGLKIDLFLHAVTFHAHVDIQYLSKTRVGAGGQSTNLDSKVKEIFGSGLVEDQDVFVENLSRYTDSFLQLIHEHGEVMASWRAGAAEKANAAEANPSPEPSGTLRQIVRLEFSDSRVREWYARMIPLVLLFIEGGQPIESDDPLWEIFVALEGEGPETVVTGFCTVYRFYHYPDSTRLRISQILVLPPYQGQGYGFRLVETINKRAVEHNCYDVTMEDPSERLQELRDCMDVQRLLNFTPCVSAIDSAVSRMRTVTDHRGVCEDIASKQLSNSTTVSTSLNGKSSWLKSNVTHKNEKNILSPPANLVEDVRKSLKISKMQLKRCWETLLFLQLQHSEEAVLDRFRELLVKQLHSEIFSKSEKDVGHGKQVFDTTNDYDNEKTFIMMHISHRRESQNGDSAPPSQQESDGSAEEKKLQALQDLLEEREAELQAVADKVSRHCKTLSTVTKQGD